MEQETLEKIADFFFDLDPIFQQAIFFGIIFIPGYIVNNL